MQLFITVFFFIYFCSIFFYFLGLFKKQKTNHENHSINVSVIVCVRNGENSIINLLNNLKFQKHNGILEFIIVDDDSTDKTSAIIKNFIQSDNRFKYLNTKGYDSDLKHKKKALSMGISYAKFSMLMFTDVDCSFGEKWVSSVANNFYNNDYIIGFSNIKPNNSFVSHFQSIDFKMLMFATLGSTLNGYPMACSGQNQAYKKSLYESINGFNDIKNILQGDDSIFLQLCIRKNKINVSFSEDSESYVTAKVHGSWKEFILQRIRWSGDANIMWKYNYIFYIIIVSTFITNLSIPFLLAFYFIFNKYLYYTLLLISIKFILEFLLYLKGSKRFNKKINLNSFLIWFLLQPFYIIFVGCFSFFNNRFLWRGRIIS